VNFDPQVCELMKEASYLKKMNLEIPANAESVCLMEKEINCNIVRLV
jgi:hypothetical protein